MNWLIGLLGVYFLGTAALRWRRGYENGAIRAVVIAALFFYMSVVL